MSSTPPHNVINSAVLLLFFASMIVVFRLLFAPISDADDFFSDSNISLNRSVSSEQLRTILLPIKQKIANITNLLNYSSGNVFDPVQFENLLQPIRNELAYVNELASAPIDIDPVVARVLASIGDKIDVPAIIDPNQLVYDYASSYLGGTIEFAHTSQSYFNSSNARLLARFFPGTGPQTSPNSVILDRGSMTPGKCWAFSKDQGSVEIHFAIPTSLDSWTISHVPLPKQLYHIAKRTIGIEKESAPREMELFGISPEKSLPTSLGTFTFDNIMSTLPTGRPVTQRFPIKSSSVYSGIRIEIKSNHGYPDYTCISRIEAFGPLPVV